MPRRTINLAAVGAAVAVVVWVGSGLIAGSGSSLDTSVGAEALAPSPDASRFVDIEGMTGYALSMPEVEGLPSDLEAGARLELWVAWDPPITKGPQIEKLVGSVVYDRTIPPMVEGEPATAMVMVPEDKVGDLMYGDRYGSLSASITTD